MSKNQIEIKLIDVIMNYNDSEEAQINFFDILNDKTYAMSKKVINYCKTYAMFDIIPIN